MVKLKPSFLIRQGEIWNIALCCVNTCCCEWSNKEADWPEDGQDEVRRENQTKDTGKKKGRE